MRIASYSIVDNGDYPCRACRAGFSQPLHMHSVDLEARSLALPINIGRDGPRTFLFLEERPHGRIFRDVPFHFRTIS